MKRQYSQMEEVSYGYENMDNYPVFKNSKKDNTGKKLKVPLDNAIYTLGNEIHFTCGVDKTTIQEVIKQMTKLIVDHEKDNGSDKLDLVYIVDSPGGSVTSILKFVDFVNMTKIKYPFVNFISVISGMAASAGTIMAVVADERYITKNAHAMIHELSTGNQGKYTHFLSYTKHLESLHACLVDIYCQKSGLSKDKVEELLNGETWFSAEEYKKHGFVQDIK